MKKLLTSLAIVLSVATVASADLARVEAGAGVWMQSPSGGISYTSTNGSFEDASNEDSQTGAYAWLLVKHPLPMIPNLKLEYVGTVSEGTYTVLTGTPVGAISTGAATKLDMTQIDVIPYYNLLDNTAWVTLDVGLDFKVISLGYTAAGVDVIDALGVDIASVVMPLAYVRARVQAPGTNLGFEADIKTIALGDNSVSDIRVKVDYTLDMVPVIQPAIEVGYRMQSFELEESGFALKTDFAGLYLGVMARF